MSIIGSLDVGEPVALGVFALAGVLGVTAIAVLIGLGVRVWRRRGSHPAPEPHPPLGRLDYLPSVTSRVPRLRWHGSTYWSIGRPIVARPEREVSREVPGFPAGVERRRGGARRAPH